MFIASSSSYSSFANRHSSLSGKKNTLSDMDESASCSNSDRHWKRQKGERASKPIDVETCVDASSNPTSLVGFVGEVMTSSGLAFRFFLQQCALDLLIWCSSL